MTAAVAKNLIGDLLANNVHVLVDSDGVGGWIVTASPTPGVDITAAQANTLATRYSVVATIPAAKFV